MRKYYVLSDRVTEEYIPPEPKKKTRRKTLWETKQDDYALLQSPSEDRLNYILTVDGKRRYVCKKRGATDEYGHQDYRWRRSYFWWTKTKIFTSAIAGVGFGLLCGGAAIGTGLALGWAFGG